MMTALEEELITENARLTQQVKQLLLELKQERDYSNDLAMRLNDWKATDEKEINELLQNIKNEYESVIDDLTKKIQSNGQNIELLEKEMTRYENYIEHAKRLILEQKEEQDREKRKRSGSGMGLSR